MGGERDPSAQEVASRCSTLPPSTDRQIRDEKIPVASMSVKADELPSTLQGSVAASERYRRSNV